MGSGSRGPYGSSGDGGSQPYAPTYHVIDSMLERDKANPYIYDSNTGYFHNPTATTLENAIDGNRVLINGKRPENILTYVLSKDGKIVIGKRFNPNKAEERAPHPTLIGGKDPVVQCAGMIKFRRGKIEAINVNSGHYRPNIKSLSKVYNALKEIYKTNPEVFHRNFKWM